MLAYQITVPEPLGGDPEQLSAAGQRYDEVVEHIRRITTRLNQIADDEQSVSEAVDAFRGQARDVAAAVDEVLPRYETTAGALRVYAVILAEAQSDADRAIAAISAERDTLLGLYSQRDAIPATPAIMGTSQAVNPEQADELRLLEARIGEHEAGLTRLVTTYQAAREAKQTAGNAAADKIVPVLEELNDSVLDTVAGFFEDVGDLGVAAGQWVVTVLEAELHLLAEFVLLATLVTSAVGVFVAVSLYAGLVNSVLGSLSAIPGVDLTELADSITPTSDQLLDGIIATGLVVTKGINVYMYATLGLEAIKPTPEMAYTGTTDFVTTKTNEDGFDSTRYEQVMLHAGSVDDAGKDAKTQVQVIRVGTDEDDKPIWRVIVPSTQDWEWFSGLNDAGAANDLGSNLSLMLTPGMPAAYERMVYDAMDRAGIQKDDPVMMVGWSQGGILAGKMATEQNYNVEAIAVAGAPIDHMDIPNDVAVVSFQHSGDHVHRLDGQAPAPASDKWVTVESEPYGSPGGYPHGSVLYANTARAIEPDPESDSIALVDEGYIDAATQQKFKEVSDMQDKFFSNTDEVASIYEGAEAF